MVSIFKKGESYDEHKKTKKIRSEHNPNLNEDDVALVIRPSFSKKNPSEWTGKVDLSALIMPVTRLDEDEHGLIKDTMHALVACFHLLNTDQEFANRISEEMDNIIGSGRIENPAGKTSSKRQKKNPNLLSGLRHLEVHRLNQRVHGPN